MDEFEAGSVPKVKRYSFSERRDGSVDRRSAQPPPKSTTEQNYFLAGVKFACGWIVVTDLTVGYDLMISAYFPADGLKTRS